MTALVVFNDNGGHCLDFLLKQGFRHCFCAIQSGDYWILIDGRIGVPDIKVIALLDYDLAAFYIKEGFTVVEAEAGKPSLLPLTLTNCVGMVKSVLGIRSMAVSPYQLYKYLRKNS